MTPAQLREIAGMREKAFAMCLRECQMGIDGFVTASMRDNFNAETGRQTHEKPHRLDETGSADALRVIVNGQVKKLLVLFPMHVATLPHRLQNAVKICTEHLRRSAEMGEKLDDKDVFKCVEEVIFFVRALHLSLRSAKNHERDQIAGLYWRHKDPTSAARHLAVPMTPTAVN